MGKSRKRPGSCKANKVSGSFSSWGGGWAAPTKDRPLFLPDFLFPCWSFFTSCFSDKEPCALSEPMTLLGVVSMLAAHARRRKDEYIPSMEPANDSIRTGSPTTCWIVLACQKHATCLSLNHWSITQSNVAIKEKQT